MSSWPSARARAPRRVFMAPRVHHGQLEIDQRRAAVGRHQPVGFLGEIVVDDVGRVQAPHQARRGAEIGRIARSGELHGRALDPAARQAPGTKSSDAGDALDAIAQRQPRERAVFAAHEVAREPRVPRAARAGIAHHGVADARDGAEDVGLELRPHLPANGIVPFTATRRAGRRRFAAGRRRWRRRRARARWRRPRCATRSAAASGSWRPCRRGG